jgi:hypothetical protein
VLDEMLTGRRADLTVKGQAVLSCHQLQDRIRRGDLGRFDTEFGQAWHLATDVLHSPELQTQLLATRAFRHTVCGDLERRADLERVYQGMQGTNWQEPVRFITDSCRMLFTGTLADHAEQIAARLARPDHPSIPHLAAPAAALGFAQRGDAERARQIAARWFTPPPWSWTWMHPIAYWAQVVAVAGGSRPRLAV